MSYINFKSRWLGQRTDTDGYPAKAIFQCVDLVKRYMSEEFGVPMGAYGDAVNYWNNTNAQVLTKFKKSSTGKAGDIVVLKGVNGNKSGHIGIVDHFNGANPVILEQNGSTGNGNGTGGNAIRTREVPVSRVMGYLSPKVAAHKYANDIGRIVNFTDTFRAWLPGTDTQARYSLKGPYYIRDTSSRPNRVVVYSKANDKVVDVALDDRNGNKYSGWNFIK